MTFFVFISFWILDLDFMSFYIRVPAYYLMDLDSKLLQKTKKKFVIKNVLLFVT